VSAEVPLDLALRLAAHDLINAEAKRAVVFLSAGRVTQNAFKKYGLSELTAYFNNNSIAFSPVLLTQGAVDPEIAYLEENTKGKSYYVFRQEGLAPVVDDLRNLPVGRYQLSYMSSLNTDMGRAFLPIEAETYLMNRSGRDESGYFVPLQ